VQRDLFETPSHVCEAVWLFNEGRNRHLQLEVEHQLNHDAAVGCR